MEIPTNGHTKTTSNGSRDDLKDDLKVGKIEIFLASILKFVLFFFVSYVKILRFYKKKF
jgi:hypothetical protein